MRLGVMDDFGAVILPPVLKTFSDAYPDVEIVMETGLTSGMVHRLARDFDLVIAMHGLAERSGEQLRREKALWAGPPNLDPRTLDPLPVALYPVGCLFRKWALQALDRSRLRWRFSNSSAIASPPSKPSQARGLLSLSSKLAPFRNRSCLSGVNTASHLSRELTSGFTARLSPSIRRQLETTIGVRPVHSA